MTSHEEAAARSAQQEPVRCAILTVSDTRSIETDEGGPIIARYVEHAGHAIVGRGLVSDEAAQIEACLEPWLADPQVQAVLVTGGTGISPRDVTVQVVRSLLTTELEGYGELFRMLSYQQVGSAAFLSRAVGGLVARPPQGGGDTFVLAMPGSPKAVDLAMRELIAPQLAHLVWQRSQ
jgi:molybdenum cofactor biosynthesis protein B